MRTHVQKPCGVAHKYRPVYDLQNTPDTETFAFMMVTNAVCIIEALSPGYEGNPIQCGYANQ